MKKELILNYLIETYLKENSPISSGGLKKKCELPFSPSTIRNYFQKLDGEGLIVKIHISSGSVPSIEALRQYWYENLQFDNIKISKNLLERVSREFDVFIAIKEKENLYLHSVLDVDSKFIILDFKKSEIVLRFSSELFYLFREFKNYSLTDIKKVLKSLSLSSIMDKFLINDMQNFNRSFLYEHYQEFSIDDLFSDKIFEQFNKGLFFNKDYLAYKFDVRIDDKENECIILGNVHNDYIRLFETIKEV